MFSSNKIKSTSNFESYDKIFAISSELLDNQEICRLAQS